MFKKTNKTPKGINETAVEAIANRVMFEVAIALMLKRSDNLKSLLLTTAKNVRSSIDSHSRQFQKEQASKLSFFKKYWQRFTGVEALKKELELTRNRQNHQLRLVADGLKQIAEGELNKDDVFHACLLKASDLKESSESIKNLKDKGTVRLAGVSLLEMGKRYKTKQETADAKTNNKK